MTNEFVPACHRMEWLDPFYKKVWETAFQKCIPISGTFELTPRCNFNCKMCYVHLDSTEMDMHGKELSAKEWLDIAKDAKSAGTTWLCVTGGEPLMHPEFEEIWQGLSEMGFFLTLQTNASLITGKIVSLLKEYPPKQVKITLYGTNDKVYESVCGVQNGFSRVNDGIHTLMSMGIPVALVSTVIRQNEEDASNMAYYAYRHQLPWTITSEIKSSFRGKGNDVSALRLENKEERRKKDIARRIKEKDYLDPERKPCTYCKDYHIGYWILWNGEMRFCSFLNEPDISVRTLGFAKAWEKLVQYEDTLEWPEECKICPANKICFKCAATIASASGSVNKVSDKFCREVCDLYDENERKVREYEF